MPILEQYVQVFAFTVAQAFTSAFTSMFFGILGAMGLWSLAKNKNALRILTAFAILPNTLPIIFVIFSFIKYLPMARGFWGIVAIHCFLNAGLVAIAVFQVFQSKMGALADVAWIASCSQVRFLKSVVLPYLKNDLTRIFFFVFALSFTSFAVPLMIGGSRGTTLEVLIYEKIRISADWSQACVMALMQLIFILGISFFVKRQVATQANYVSKSPLLSVDFGIFVLVLPTIFIGFCLMQSFFSQFEKWQMPNLSLVFGSLFIAIGSGLFNLFLLFVSARYRPNPKWRSFLLGLVSPSAVIIGFSLIWLFPGVGWASYIKLIFGLTLMHFPILYRMSWDAQVFALYQQIETAQTLSASPRQIFSRVIVPQVLKYAYNLSGLAALWSFSDFTLASVVAERDLTLAQLFSHLTESYRFEQAEALILPMMVGAIFCYLIFSGVGNVASRILMRTV